MIKSNLYEHIKKGTIYSNVSFNNKDTFNALLYLAKTRKDYRIDRYKQEGGYYYDIVRRCYNNNRSVCWDTVEISFTLKLKTPWNL